MFISNFNFITWLLNDYWWRLRWLVDISSWGLNQYWDENSVFFFKINFLHLQTYFFIPVPSFQIYENKTSCWLMLGNVLQMEAARNATVCHNNLQPGWSSTLIGQKLDLSPASPHKPLPCESHPHQHRSSNIWHHVAKVRCSTFLKYLTVPVWKPPRATATRNN